MRFWQGDPEAVKVRWYRAEPSAKVVDGWSRFRSFSTWDRGEKIQALGEQSPARGTSYERGFNFGNWQGQHWEGTPEVWENGGIHGQTPGIVTDANGGTTDCPWMGQANPIVMATSLHGKGQVVCLGSPSLFREQGIGDAPVPDWNTLLLSALRKWQIANGRNQPIGTPEDCQDWLMTASKPTKSNLGGESIDYSDYATQTALQISLFQIAMMWVGWNNLDYANSHQFFNSDIVYLIKQWVIDGGCLVVVNNTLLWDSEDPHPLNKLLDDLNVEMQFQHGDGEATHSVTRNGFDAIPGIDSPPAPGIWGNQKHLWPQYGGQASCILDSTHTVAAMVQFVGFTGLVVPPPATWVMVEFEAWADSANAISSLTMRWNDVSPSAFKVLLTGLTTSPKKYTFGGPNDPNYWTVLERIIPGEIQIVANRLTGSPTVSMRNFSITFYYCGASPPCGCDLIINQGHPLIKGSDTPITKIDSGSFCTVAGGFWVAAVCSNEVNPQPQGQMFLQRITAVGSGTFEPQSETGSGEATLGTGALVAAGEGTFIPPNPTGAGAAVLGTGALVAAGEGTFVPEGATGSGAAAMHQLVAAGLGGYVSNPTGSGTAAMHQLVAAGVGGYVSNPTGAGAAMIVEFQASGSGTYRAPPGFVELTGSGTWTVPDGVYSIDIYAIGAGGDGAADDAFADGGGGGGGGAAVITLSIAVVPGQTFAYAVPTGTGATTTFGTVCIADYGRSGDNISGGAKGQASACTGTSAWDGGIGADPVSPIGGGGGASGANGVNGANGVSFHGGSSVGGGGFGGDGGIGVIGGNGGGAPGGGGGGSGGGAGDGSGGSLGNGGYLKVSWPGT